MAQVLVVDGQAVSGMEGWDTSKIHEVLAALEAPCKYYKDITTEKHGVLKLETLVGFQWAFRKEDAWDKVREGC